MSEVRQGVQVDDSRGVGDGEVGVAVMAQKEENFYLRTHLHLNFSVCLSLCRGQFSSLSLCLDKVRGSFGWLEIEMVVVGCCAHQRR